METTEVVKANLLARNFTAFEDYYAPKAMAKFLGCGHVITSRELPDYMKTSGDILHNLNEETIKQFLRDHHLKANSEESSEISENRSTRDAVPNSRGSKNPVNDQKISENRATSSGSGRRSKGKQSVFNSLSMDNDEDEDNETLIPAKSQKQKGKRGKRIEESEMEIDELEKREILKRITIYEQNAPLMVGDIILHMTGATKRRLQRDELYLRAIKKYDILLLWAILEKALRIPPIDQALALEQQEGKLRRLRQRKNEHIEEYNTVFLQQWQQCMYQHTAITEAQVANIYMYSVSEQYITYVTLLNVEGKMPRTLTQAMDCVTRWHNNSSSTRNSMMHQRNEAAYRLDFDDRRGQAKNNSREMNVEESDNGNKEACRFYKANGWCKYGTRCRYSHEDNTNGNNNSNESKATEREKDKEKPTMCRNMKEKGWCQYGDNCRFSHNM